MLECPNIMRAFQRTLLFVAILIASAAVVAPQSGRRGTTKSTTTTNPSTTGPKEAEPKPQKAPRLQLLVGIEDPNPFDQVPYYLVDTVLEACIRRLDEAAGVIVNGGPRRMTRGDAVKAAKAETARYVVWLQVRNELADSGAQASNGAQELYINYMILEPGTGKVKQSGRAQHRIYKVGNVGVGLPPSSRRSPEYSEYAIRQSAREAADMILAAFDISAEGPWPR